MYDKETGKKIQARSLGMRRIIAADVAGIALAHSRAGPGLSQEFPD